MTPSGALTCAAVWELTAYTNGCVANTNHFCGELHQPILQLGVSYGLSSLTYRTTPPDIAGVMSARAWSRACARGRPASAAAEKYAPYSRYGKRLSTFRACSACCSGFGKERDAYLCFPTCKGVVHIFFSVVASLTLFKITEPGSRHTVVDTFEFRRAT